MTAPIPPVGAGLIIMGIFMLVGFWPLGIALIIWGVFYIANYRNQRRHAAQLRTQRRDDQDEREMIALGKWMRS